MTSAEIRARAASLVGLAVLCVAVFVVSAQATTFKVLYSLPGANESSPQGTLILDAAGNIYGTALSNGSCLGVVFELNSAGQQVALHCVGGETLFETLLRDSLGNLYGTTYGNGTYADGTIFELDISGKVTVLHNFKGPPVDGKTPGAGLIRDAAGNLYGTTIFGGSQGNGTVFKLAANGHESVLHSFSGTPGGQFPWGGLVRDESGNLYGTTAFGGTHANGMVFKLSRAGKPTTLYSFTGEKDGLRPVSGLVRDSAGNLYGTTAGGGTGKCRGGCGTVFKIDTKGNTLTLYRFAGGRDGQEPIGGLVMDTSGNLYGTTAGNTTISRSFRDVSSGGEARSGVNAFGTVFKLDTKGRETVLHRFTGKNDGKYPYAGLAMDAAGNLYGTAVDGGANGCGTVFRVTP